MEFRGEHEKVMQWVKRFSISIDEILREQDRRLFKLESGNSGLVVWQDCFEGQSLLKTP
jgi:hypothetical protein